jgi:hypothetical protein
MISSTATATLPSQSPAQVCATVGAAPIAMSGGERQQEQLDDGRESSVRLTFRRRT